MVERARGAPWRSADVTIDLPTPAANARRDVSHERHSRRSSSRPYRDLGLSWKTVDVFDAIANLTPVETVFGGKIARSKNAGSPRLLDGIPS